MNLVDLCEMIAGMELCPQLRVGNLLLRTMLEIFANVVVS